VGDRDPYRFLLRMPQGLREQLSAAAQQNGRSLNAEIVARLAESVAPAPERRALRPRLASVGAAAAIAAALVAVVDRDGSRHDSAAVQPKPGLKAESIPNFAVYR
jgi:hypothetical protein